MRGYRRSRSRTVLQLLAPFTFVIRYVRQEAHSVVGRDHLMYRSYYVPVKDVIDGDLYAPSTPLSLILSFPVIQ